jgi:ADP-ribose pyrophosphatase
VKPPRVTRKGVVHKNPFMEVRHSHADFGDYDKDYYVIHFGRRAGIVMLRDDAVLLVRQYRFLVDALTWELPGGTIDDGEDLQIGAIRECLEETGLECESLNELVVYYPGLDNVDNRTTIFWTRAFAEKRPFNANASEIREIAWLPVRDCLRMIGEGAILDAMTVVGLTSLVSLGVWSTRERR